MSLAKFLAVFHLVCTILWIPVTVVAYLLGWLESVTFVSIISMLALFLGSFSSYQASRAELQQVSAERKQRSVWRKLFRMS